MMMRQVTFQQEPVTLLGTDIKVGDSAPNFTVLSTNLKEVTLDNYKDSVKLISVVPSIDTGVCSKQTKRFNEEAKSFGDVDVLTISMDLPFAQSRWKSEHHVEHLDILSDHREANFGEKYGVLIKELRLLSRSIFVVDVNNRITYVEYVQEVTDHPNYDKVLEHLKDLM